MNSNVYKILIELFSTDSYITYQYLSQLLGISVRSVNRLIPQAAEYLTKNKIPFEIVRGKGIRLISDHNKCGEYLHKLQNITPSLSDTERILLISIELIEADDYIKSEYFTSKYMVSSSLINKDLQLIEESAKAYKIQLLRERGSGILLCGDRFAKTLFQVDTIIQNIDFSKLDVLGDAPFSDKIFRKVLSSSVREKLAQLSRPPELNRLHQSLTSFDQSLAYSLVIENYSRLVLTLVYMGIQSRSELGVNYGKEDSYISRLLAATLGSNVRVDEKQYVYLTDFYESSRKIKYEDEVPNQGIVKEKILHDLYAEFGSKMERSKIQSDMLDYHINLFIRRYTSEINATNQLVDKIKSEHPIVFAKVKQILLNNGFTKVIDDEITFITMHILGAMLEHKNKRGQVKLALVCMSGFGTSKMLKETLRTHFPGAMISKIASLKDLDELALIKGGVSLIVSTVTLQTTFLPVIMVEPILCGRDLESIRRVIGQQKKTIPRQEVTLEYFGNLGQVLEDMLCEKEVNLDSMDAVIQHVSNRICPDREIAIQLYNEFIRRERYGSTVLSDGVILLHTKFQNITSFGVFSLLSELPYRTLDGFVQINTVISMVIPLDAEDETVNLFSQISIALIKEHELLKFIKSMDRDLIVTTIKNLINPRSKKV